MPLPDGAIKLTAWLAQAALPLFTLKTAFGYAEMLYITVSDCVCPHSFALVRYTP